MTSITQAIRYGADLLEGIADNPRLEARLLLAHSLGLTRNDLIRDPAREVDVTAFETLVARRAAREPVALIVGYREFWSMRFQVSSATLIPRPDSETLIEAAIAAFANRPPPRRILDLGTGTGCLLLSLLTEFPAAFGIGTDIAPAAASLAGMNAAHLGLAQRSAFLVGDWSRPLSARFDLIISNPPYIPAAEVTALMPEVALHEPRSALEGGGDGYDAYCDIFDNLHHILEPDGVAILELGIGQATYVGKMARNAGFECSLACDLAKVPRALILTYASRLKNRLASP